MTTLPLIFDHGHLFVEMQGNLWLLDTGAPGSFGTGGTLLIDGARFSVNPSHFGLTSATLTQHVGVECSGLLGADILGRFDHILDAMGGRITLSVSELSHDGQKINLDEFMGIPIVNARIGGTDYRMFFDTGAQISYFQGESLAGFPSAGSVTDFYPGFGQFQTETHEVPISIGGISFIVRCGRLPGRLGTALMMAGTKGIIGNQLLTDRIAGFFPRRRVLCL